MPGNVKVTRNHEAARVVVYVAADKWMDSVSVYIHHDEYAGYTEEQMQDLREQVAELVGRYYS